MRGAVFVFLFLCHLHTTACLAQEWADFKGRFTFEGKIPERKELKASELDMAAVGLPKDHKVLDESLVVDEKSKGIANILLWIIPDPSAPDAKMPLHPTYDMSPPKEHVIRSQQLVFTPHVSIMRTATKELLFLYVDPISHNSNLSSPEIPASCRSLPAGNRDLWTIKKETKIPALIQCNIHPYEKAYLLVRDNPYFAVTNEKGEFEIKHLPLGKWRFKVWQEKCGWIKEATLAGKKTAWTKGELEVEIPKEGLDLGEVVIAGELFSDKKIAAPPAK